MRRPLLAALFVLALAAAGLARADEPRTWRSFKVCSLNAQFCAAITSAAVPTKPAWQQSWTLQVSDATGRILWSASYPYDGHPEGLLSDDGRTFVYVSGRYRHAEPVLSIYSASGRITVPGSSFPVPEPVRTSTRTSWLAEERRPRLDATGRVEVHTRDGRTHTVDTSTGRVLSK